jgi:hypothetical protein
MNSPQQSLASFSTGSSQGLEHLRSSLDEDVALGCECADPALQIDRWGAEAGALDLERD